MLDTIQSERFQNQNLIEGIGINCCVEKQKINLRLTFRT